MMFVYPEAHYRRSSAYLSAIALTDTFSFYFDFLACAFLCLFYGGWHDVIKRPVYLICAVGACVPLTLRFIELRRPAFYHRWRMWFMRFCRCFKTVIFLEAGFFIRYQLRRGAFNHLAIETAFSWHKIQAASALHTLRSLIIASAAFVGFAATERILPVVEQVGIQLLVLVSALFTISKPATLVMQQPSFEKGIQSLCHTISAASFYTFYLPITPRQVVHQTCLETCGAQAAQHLVLFIQLHLIFTLPVFVSRCYYRVLRLRYLIDLTRARDQVPSDSPTCDTQLHPDEALAVRSNKLLWQYLAMEGMLFCYALLVSWRFIVDGGAALLRWADTLQDSLDWATEKFYSLLGVTA